MIKCSRNQAHQFQQDKEIRPIKLHISFTAINILLYSYQNVPKPTTNKNGLMGVEPKTSQRRNTQVDKYTCKYKE